jgi:hypothetical protein
MLWRLLDAAAESRQSLSERLGQGDRVVSIEDPKIIHWADP